jgi:GTPase Era involved in 16S rRNA processing/flagellar basal body-associated protein FliL
MNTVKDSLEKLMQINQRYGLPEDGIFTFVAEMDKELLCVPIIGTFSSGKSAAVNTLMGYGRRILAEDITPETAIPTEIQYKQNRQSEDSVKVFFNNGDDILIFFRDYISGERDKLNAADIKSVRLRLGNDFFAQIPRIRLVDMPGFGSGDDIHDRAINNYVSNSMAYIIAFPAEPEHMVLKEDLRGILKELLVLNKPTYVMITKYDKVQPQDNYEATLANLGNMLTQYMGGREFEYMETSSLKGDVDDLKKCLLELQNKSEELLREQKFLPFLHTEAAKTLAYLRERIEKNYMNESELKEREEKLNSDMNQLTKKTAERAHAFRRETDLCVNEIIGDARAAMSRELDSFVAMVLNKTDQQTISERINSAVRVAVNESLQRRFIAKAQKYMDGITADIVATESLVAGYLDAGKSGGSFAGTLGGAFAGGTLGSIGTAVAAKIAGGVLLSGSAFLGLGFAPIVIGTLAIPIVNVVVVISSIIGSIIAFFTGKNKKREEQRAQVMMKLQSEVFPNILNQLTPVVQNFLDNTRDDICNNIEKQLKERKEALEKALADVRREQTNETAAQEQALSDMKIDIGRIGGLLNGV